MHMRRWILIVIGILLFWAHRNREVKPHGQISSSKLIAERHERAQLKQEIHREPAASEIKAPASNWTPPEVTLHYLYYTDDNNLSENEALCDAKTPQDWTQACDQVSEFFARNRNWEEANDYADIPCQSGDATSCILLAKIAWKSSGSAENAYLQFQRACATEDGQASPYIETEEYGTLIRTDRLACRTLEQYPDDPQDGWEAILSMNYAAENHTFSQYFDESF